MSRAFSTSAKGFLKFIWKGMTENALWQDNARAAIASKSKLPEIDIAEVQGKPQKSKDPKEHISVTLLDKEGKRVTSMHVYTDGSGTCSKQKYN